MTSSVCHSLNLFPTKIQPCLIRRCIGAFVCLQFTTLRFCLPLLSAAPITSEPSDQTEQIRFSNYACVEQPCDAIGGGISNICGIYVNDIGWIQDYTRSATGVISVREWLVDRKDVFPLLSQLISVAKSNVLVRSAEVRKHPITKTSNLVAFGEAFKTQTIVLNSPTEPACEPLLASIRSLQARPLPLSQLDPAFYIRVVPICEGESDVSNVHEEFYRLDQAAASKADDLYRAVRHPWRLIGVPHERNPFAAFTKSFSPGQSLKLIVGNKRFSAESFAVIKKNELEQL